MANVPDLLKSGVHTSKRLGREAGRRLERIPPRVEFPWYDSIWLSSYLQARTFLEQHRPDKLDEFEHALSVLRTNPDFDVTVLDDLFDADVLNRIRETIAGYKVPKQIEVSTDPLPKSGAGKILKRTLREPHWEGHDTAIV